MSTHPFPPLYDPNSTLLILGSFPSVKSRENNFFYGHPQNRFWKVLAALYQVKIPTTIEEKKQLLHSKHVALWDVIASCNITGSADSSIQNVCPNDLHRILQQSKIQKIYTNGKTAYRLYEKYIAPSLSLPYSYLPSTSPANAVWSLERLITEWSKQMLPLAHSDM